MESLLQDLKFAVKVLLKRPLFTIAAVITLALGIGANSAVFSVIHGVLLSPLPFPQSDQLVMVWQSLPAAGLNEAPASPANFEDWRQENQVFEDLTALRLDVLTLQGGQEPQSVRVGWVTPGFFQMLRVPAFAGRTLQATADDPAAAQEVVLSYALWSSRFGADPAIVGSNVQLDDRTYRVVGVLPKDFRFVNDADVWLTQIFTPDDLAQRLNLSQRVVGRIRDGVSLSQAQANMNGVAAQLGEAHPSSNAGWQVRLVPLRDSVVGDIALSLWILFGVVGFVLLVACTNVASLLLARASEREQEFAMRQALGAGRGRLIRQALTESVVLALVGGATGLLLAYACILMLVKARPAGIPRIEEITMDPTVLGFSLLVSLLTGLIFGLLPALQSPKARLSEMMKEGLGSSMGGGAFRRLRSVFVVLEISLALVLLIGAGLTVRSFQKLQQVDPGFRPEGVVATDLTLPDGSYPSSAQQMDFFDRVRAEMERIPAVREAAYVTTLPLTGREEKQLLMIEGRPPNPRIPDGAGLDAVSPGYFRTMGIELIAGRPFSDADRGDSAPVVIINEAMARHYWPGDSALGKRLVVPGVSGQYRQVVGVVGNVKRYGLQTDGRLEVYVPYAQHPRSRSMSFVLRVDPKVDPETLVAPARAAVWSVDRSQAISDVTTMDQLFADTTSQRRLNTWLISLAAMLALVLAVLGIYGVLAYFVSQRRREIGLRMALGAGQSDVLKVVLGQGMRLTALGVGIGLVAALFLTRLMTSLLFGIGAVDPVTFASVSLIFFLASLAASLLPARRAARMDPLSALRQE